MGIYRALVPRSVRRSVRITPHRYVFTHMFEGRPPLPGVGDKCVWHTAPLIVCGVYCGIAVACHKHGCRTGTSGLVWVRAMPSSVMVVIGSCACSQGAHPWGANARHTWGIVRTAAFVACVPAVGVPEGCVRLAVVTPMCQLPDGQAG